MGQKYVVQILTDSEFDSLPYRNISHSIGIADKEKGLAFVRESGSKAMDLMTLTHEVNHLISTTKTDADEDGIMHKGDAPKAPSRANYAGDVESNTQHAQNFFSQNYPQYQNHLTPQEWSNLQGKLVPTAQSDPYYGSLGKSYTSKYSGTTTSTVPGVGLAQAVDSYITDRDAGGGGNINTAQFASEQSRGEGFRKAPGLFSGGNIGTLLGAIAASLLFPGMGLPMTMAAGGLGSAVGKAAGSGIGGESFNVGDIGKSFGMGAAGSGLARGLGFTKAATTASQAPQLVAPLGQQFATQQAGQFGTQVGSNALGGLVSGGARGLTSIPFSSAGATPSLLGMTSFPKVGGTNIGSTGATPGVSSANIPGISAPNFTANPLQTSFNQSQQNLLGGGSALNTPSMPSTPSMMPNVNAVEVAPKTDWMGTLGKEAGKLVTPQNILGGASLLASQSIKQPEFQMPESVEAIRGKLLSPQGGLTEIGKQAQLELGNILKSTPQELYAPGTDVYYQNTLKNLDNEYTRQKKALAQQWNAIDPNYQYNGEYILSDDRLNKSYMEVKNNYVSQEEQRRFELARTTKYQAIQDSLGVDKNTMDGLVGLSGLDVQTAAMMYGAKVQDVQTLREALGTLGIELLMRGQGGMQSQGGVNINLGK